MCIQVQRQAGTHSAAADHHELRRPRDDEQRRAAVLCENTEG